SSKLVVHRQPDAPCEASQGPSDASPSRVRLRVAPQVVPAGSGAIQAKAQLAQPLEPILIPKLRIYFADFPYLHCSINQRLFTLETCCGYEYDLARELFPPGDFQG